MTQPYTEWIEKTLGIHAEKLARLSERIALLETVARQHGPLPGDDMGRESELIPSLALPALTMEPQWRRIAALRKALQLTQRELAARLEVSECTLQRWENGTQNPSPMAWRVIRELAQKAGMDVAAA